MEEAKGKEENNNPDDGICAMCGEHVLGRVDQCDKPARGMCGCSYWSFNPIVGKWIRGASFDLIGDHE